MRSTSIGLDLKKKVLLSKKKCLGWGNKSQQIEFKVGFLVFSKLSLFCAEEKNNDLKV